jgi:hypothetical protein
LDIETQRLAEEVRAMPPEAWQAHPLGFAGNTAVPLISVNGEANDFFAGPMAETAWLRQAPYFRQVLSSFKVVFGRSRLMGLGGGSEVPRHCDINYHWFSRVRIHVPVVTFPEVEFHCAGEMIHMAAGEAWIFDNWLLHHVVNPTDKLRIHLVADTVGSSAFWDMADAALDAAEAGRELEATNVTFDPAARPAIEVERINTPDVMHPGEMEVLIEDLIEDLQASGERNPKGPVDQFTARLRAFLQDWKKLWTLYGESEPGWGAYERVRNKLLNELYAMRKPLLVASNDRVAQKVMLSRVLVACVHKPLPGMSEIQYG